MNNSRDQIYTIGVWLVVAAAAVLFLRNLGSIIGLALMLGIAGGLGYAADQLYPSRHANGWMGAAAQGLVGALVGQWLFGKMGPTVAGVGLIPAFLGALLVNAALRAKIRMDRAQALEALQAQGGTGDPLLTTKVDDYRIFKALGSGGYSKVYQAVNDRTLDEVDSVAIKVFNESALKSEGFMERLDREVRLCQKLNHPNIMRILKAGEQNEMHYIVMEYVRGGTLSQRLEKGLMDIPEAITLLLDLAAAMGHAHSRGIVHRDIKPDNILLSKTGPKIMDFGLARLEGTSSLTQSGSAVGTPHYMPPEQILGEKVLDGRCDQYALGALAFELLTGSKVFSGDQAVVVLMKHVHEPPRDPRELRPEVPEALSQVVLRMLAKDREDRFPNLEAVVEELRKIKDGQPALSKPAAPTPAMAAPRLSDATGLVD